MSVALSGARRSSALAGPSRLSLQGQARYAGKYKGPPPSRRRKGPEAVEPPSTVEEQLRLVRQLEVVAQQRQQTFGAWEAPMPTLDVAIPYAVAPWSKSKFSGIRERFSQWQTNVLNSSKNLNSMLMVFSENSIPGLNIYTMGWRRTFGVPFGLLSTRSLKPTSWLAPLRQTLLSNYIDLQHALARRDQDKISRMAQPPYLNELEKIIRKDRRNTYHWTFHREVSPARILSLRTIIGHWGVNAPTVGNRLLINVLVKFETEQSLEIYDPQHKPLHTPDPSAPREGRRVPAEKRVLTEYYVFEKRMYTDTPWQVKERLYPKPGMKVSL